MAKAIATILLTGLIILLSVEIMQRGWGIEPLSWSWIIGGYVGVLVLSAFVGLVNSD